MRKYFLLSFALLALLVAVPGAADASSIFGGRITTTSIPGVTCTPPVVFGPFFILPSGGFAGPYVLTMNHGIAGGGKWILGLYQPIINLTYCHTDSNPPAPVPVYVVGMTFGISR